jgi:DNA-binding transcriptional regulator YdaS (Cro superfamily)
MTKQTATVQAAVLRAAEHLGSQTQLAAELGVTTPTVNQWVKGTRPIPVQHCLAIEQLTGVSRRELRPDDWKTIWPELERRKTKRRSTDK